MKNSNRTAEQQLLQIIETLNCHQVTLNDDSFFEVLKALTSICINKQIVKSIITYRDALNAVRLDNTIQFTERETQVVLMIGEGLKNLKIAECLNLSISTIETHRKNIRKKLKLKGIDNLQTYAFIFNFQYQYVNNDDNF